MKTIVVIQEDQKLTEEELKAIERKFNKEPIVYHVIPNDDLELEKIKDHIKRLLTEVDCNIVVATQLPLIIMSLSVWYGCCVNVFGKDKTIVYNIHVLHNYYENDKKVVRVAGYVHESNDKESKENEN